MSSVHITRVKDPSAVAHAALRFFVAAAEKSIDAKGSFSVALSGGSTPKMLYELLARGEYIARIGGCNDFSGWWQWHVYRKPVSHAVIRWYGWRRRAVRS